MKRKIIDDLIEWKNNKNRMPLLLFGARQVGKTYILNEFGDKYYDNVVYVNLESNLSVASFFSDDISPERIIKFLEVAFNQIILPEKTLIILDEIQSCERALTSLKYFYEQLPEYHIAGAGSLLGIAVNRIKYSFPVGKVQTLTLFPMDFEEFLMALNEERLIELIQESYKTLIPLPEALHNKAIDLYREYLIVGGMPACVNEYKNNRKLLMVQNIQSEIIRNYVADMAKYASSSETVKIRSCFQSIPIQLAKENKKFQYKIVQKGGSSSLFGPSIDWLEQSGIIIKCQKVLHGINPIFVYSDLSSFKLYMSDIGLLVQSSGITLSTILTGEANIYMGAITENYVAQQLLVNHKSLYYWTSSYTAEVDFILQYQGAIYAVEVKKGRNTKSRSLTEFDNKYSPNYLIRFSEKNFGKSDKIISLPLYSVFCLK